MDKSIASILTPDCSAVLLWTFWYQSGSCLTLAESRPHSSRGKPYKICNGLKASGRAAEKPKASPNCTNFDQPRRDHGAFFAKVLQNAKIHKQHGA